MPHLLSRGITFVFAGVAFSIFSACSAVPSSGPSSAAIERAGATPAADGIQLVDVTESVSRQLLAERTKTDFANTLGDRADFQQQLGVGDTLQVSIWEAPPATLFGADQSDASTGASGSRVTTLPEQTIDGSGLINVPFVGAIMAAGRTPRQLQGDVVARLRGKSHDPQVLVKLSRNETSYVTVIGDVVASARMPISARGERLLDAIAAAGGVKDPIDKVTLQVTRKSLITSLPLERVIADPKQNVPLRAGDVVTALFQPYSFLALGATGKNEEINFEAQGITLAQALARSGGLQDARSDAKGVFIFRLENATALPWPNQPLHTTVDNKVPVVYRLNLRDPNSFFVAQTFMMSNKDLLFVSNAPVSEIQKVLNLFFSVAYPVVTGVQTFR